MIWKLLKRNISAWQIGGYAVANLVGLWIVISAVQFYTDFKAAVSAENPSAQGITLVSPRNVVISKPVGMKSTLTGNTPSFTPSEIEKLEKQPWCSRVSAFQASDFGVWASVDFGDRSMSTALFFESVPDDLIDVSGIDWTFDPSSPIIPVIISKDYLALYNFGFAASGRMPLVSESMMSSIPLSVTLVGNGMRDTYPARIVGFSSTLNTIAVPQQFMDWAHGIYGAGTKEPPTRLIVEVSDSGDPVVETFFRSEGYEIAGPADHNSKAVYLVRIIMSVIMLVGVVITALSLFILMLSLFLLIQKNKRTVSGLLLLGYTPRTVARRYITLVAVVNAVVLIASVALMIAARSIWLAPLESLSVAESSAAGLSFSVVTACMIVIAVTTVNATTISRLVTRIFRR